jgi:hypothetical protein
LWVEVGEPLNAGELCAIIPLVFIFFV